MVSVKMGDSKQDDKPVSRVATAVVSTVKFPQTVLKNGTKMEERSPELNGTRGNSTLKPVNDNSSESATPHSRNGTVQYQTIKDSSGNVRLIVKKTGATNFIDADAIFKFPTTLSKEMLRKKFKMSTVAKRVPLINTVGNQSKLVPLTPTPQSQVPAVSSESSKTSETSKPVSILEARLTNSTGSAISNSVQSSPNAGQSNGVSKRIQPLILVPTQPLLDNKDFNSHEVIGAPKDAQGDASKSHSLHVSKKPQAVISCEKGLTRLVAVQPRTVAMVDVSIQVFIPQSEDQGLDAQTSPVPVDSSTLSGCVQAAGAKSSMPLPQKQLVFLDTKSGKKVVAIPKQILNSYNGPKTFVIDGKSLKRKADDSPELISKRILCGPSVESLETSDSPYQPKRLIISPGTLGVSRSLDNSLNSPNIGTIVCKYLPDKTNPTILTVSSSIPSDTVTTSSSFVLMSHPSINGGASDSIVSVNPSTFSGSRASDFNTIDGASKAKVCSDALVLPLNSSLKHNSEPVSSPSIQSFSLHKSVAQSQCNLILVPNGVNQGHKETEDKAKVKMAENSKKLKEVSNNEVKEVKMSVNFHTANKQLLKLTEGSNHSAVFDAEPSIMTDHLKAKFVKDSTDGIEGQGSNAICRRILQVQKSGSLPIRTETKMGLSTRSQGNCGAPMDSSDGSHSNDAVNETSEGEADNFVKNVFTEFRNCLIPCQGKFPIHFAVEANDCTAVRRQCILLKTRRGSVDVLNSKDETPLQLALYHGNTSIIQILLQHGADTSIFDSEGNSTLHLAVVNAEHALEDLLKFCQHNKKFLNHLNDEGFSALHLAAQYGKLKAIDRLVKYGADIDHPDGRSGRSALFHAMERKNYKAMKFLENLGANLKEATYTGFTPLHLTRSDAIAQITSSQGTVVTEIDADTLLRSYTQSNILKVK